MVSGCFSGRTSPFNLALECQHAYFSVRIIPKISGLSMVVWISERFDILNPVGRKSDVELNNIRLAVSVLWVYARRVIQSMPTVFVKFMTRV